MRDYCDGELYKSCELFQNDPHALQLFLYYDDVEVCNPLGSAATVHKLGITNCTRKNDYNDYFLGLFYYTLGNIEPRYRANLDTIQLVCITKSSCIDKYGMDTILEPFIESVRTLKSVCIHILYTKKPCIVYFHFICRMALIFLFKVLGTI